METIPSGGTGAMEIAAGEAEYSEWLQRNLSLGVLWFMGYLGTLLFASFLLSVAGRPIVSSAILWPVFVLLLWALARRGRRFISGRGTGELPPEWTFVVQWKSFLLGQIPALLFLPALASAAKAPDTASPSFAVVLIVLFAAALLWGVVLKVLRINERLRPKPVSVS